MCLLVPNFRWQKVRDPSTHAASEVQTSDPTEVALADVQCLVALSGSWPRLQKCTAFYTLAPS